jgi:hypothetical protein
MPTMLLRDLGDLKMAYKNLKISSSENRVNCFKFEIQTRDRARARARTHTHTHTHIYIYIYIYALKT